MRELRFLTFKGKHFTFSKVKTARSFSKRFTSKDFKTAVIYGADELSSVLLVYVMYKTSLP